MNDKPDPKQSGIVPLENKALTTRSSALIKRGLEALVSQEPRTVYFPKGRSLGNYIVYDGSKCDPLRRPEKFPFSQWAMAKGSIIVPPGKLVYLEVKYSADLFTTSEDLAAFSRLRPNDVHTASVNNAYGGLKGERLVFLQNLTDLKGFQVSFRDLEGGSVYLTHLPHLEELSLIGIPDVGLALVEGLTRLQFLDLRFPVLTLKERQSLSNAHILGAGLVFLQHLPCLQELSLQGRKISAGGFGYLGCLQELRYLNLRGTNITDTGLAHIGRLLELRHLDLSYTPITDEGLKRLKALNKLESLHVDGSHIGRVGVNYLKQTFPNCYVSNQSNR